MKRFLALLVPLVAVCASPANALTVKCVSTSQGLRNALQATFNGDDVEIRMKAGTYATGGNAFIVSLASDKHLKLSGGWNNDVCEAQQQDAALTVLDAGNTGYVIHLATYNTSTSPTGELSNFTIADGNGNFSPSGGMYVDFQHDTPQLLMDRMHFVGNDNSGPGGALHIRNRSKGFVELRNSLITGNSAADGAGVNVAVQDPDATILLVNNTITDNHATAANSSAGGFSIDFSNPSVGLIQLRNNAMAGNTHGANVTPADAFADAWSAGFESTNNAYSVAPAGKFNDAGSLIGPAGFVGNGNFRLRETSPLIDAGAALSADDAGSRDLDFRSRIVGIAADIGAYEFDNRFFGDGFE